MKAFNLFLFLLLMHVFGSLLYAVTLDTDTFNSNTDGWGGTGESWDSTGHRLAINRNQTGTKTYTFSGYAGQTVTVSLLATKTNTWESSDIIQITANGKSVYNSNTDGIISFDVILNGSSQLSLVVTPNTNNNNEDMYVDDVSITYTPLSTLSIESNSTTEGNGGTKALSFTVTQSASSGADTTVNYSTSNGTATSGSDYVAVTNQSITIPAGSTTATASVTIKGDTVYEEDENFTVTLSSASGATIGSSTAIGTIRNDDAIPDLTITKSASTNWINQSSAMSYDLNITNTMASTSAANIIVTDTLPSGMIFLSDSHISTNPSKASPWTCTGIGIPVVVTCSSVELYKNSTSTLTLNVLSPTSNASDPITFSNNANVSSDNLGSTNSNTVSVILNRPPTAVNDSYSTASHTVVSDNVLTNDSDLDGDILTVGSPGTYTLNYGELIININGSFTYTPGYFTGVAETYTYTVVDSHGASSTATLQISIASECTDTGVSASERAFCLRKQTVLFGDMMTIGNTLIVPPNPQPSSPNETTYCSSYTTGSFLTQTPGLDNQSLYLCNYKPDTYLNATSAELLTPTGSTIKWAGLYFQAVIRRSDVSSLSSMDVKIKKDSGSYVSAGTPVIVNYDSNYTSNGGRNYGNYSAFIDITSVFTSNNWANGNYTVANVPVTTDTLQGSSSVIGKYGGWSLVVIYENVDSPLKSVSVYDGWQQIKGSSGSSAATITVNNFYTPTSGTIDSLVSVFVAEGDAERNGAYFKTGSTSLGNSADAFSSLIISTGVRTPSLINNQGIDIQTYQLGTTGYNVLANSQNSISFSLTTRGVELDYYYPSMLSFSTEVYHPRMCYYENLYDATDTLLSTGSLVNKGSTIHARVLLQNDQNEPAKNVLLYKNFDTTFPYIANSTKLNNAGNPTLISSTSAVTDALDSDVFQYATAIDQFMLNVGTGATNVLGGNFASNQTSLFDYNASADFDGNTSIVYQIAYTMPTIGFRYEGELAKCVDFNSTFGVLPAAAISAIGFDTRETSIAQADNNRSITTKIANKAFQLNVVSLDNSGNIGAFVGVNNTSVFLFSVDTAECSLPQSELLSLTNSVPRTNYVIFNTGDIIHASQNFNLSNASKDKKIAINYINWSAAFQNASFNCSNSNTQAVLKGVPQCLNADHKIGGVFGIDVQNACAGGAAHGMNPAVANPACQSNSYNAGNLPDSPYNNDYGCYQCISGLAGTISCSTDNFAIRPEKIVVTSLNPDMPNLLRSAKDYNTTLHAYNYGTITDTVDYNVTNANTVFEVNSTKYDRNDEVNLTMVGTAAFGTSNFNMSNGISLKPGSNEVAEITFDDVGKIDFHIEDKIWSAVDNDDTPMDCSANGTCICGDINVTFIPEHFEFNTLTITNDNGNPGTYTYIANEVTQMAARIDTTIRALNKDGGVTQNFDIFPLYENNVTVVPVVLKSTYPYHDANETNITNLTIGFASGVRNIPWNDTNTSTYLRFNFKRDVNQSVNPFDVNGSDLNMSITSTYVDGLKQADINGSRLGTGVANLPYTVVSSSAGNSTFIYGRTHAPRYRFVGTDGNASMYYEAFCSGVDCNKTLLPNGANSNSSDDPRWFKNTFHNATTGGNATTINQKGFAIGTGSVTGTTASVTTPAQSDLNYTASATKGYPYKTTMENNASSWLIYNKYDPAAEKNEFEVEFTKAAGDWAGIRETNTSTVSGGAAKTNRRTMW